MSEAAFELHSSRLVTPTCSRARPWGLNGLAGVGHAVPSKRSSPPAEKWPVCIGGLGRSQGAGGRNISISDESRLHRNRDAADPRVSITTSPIRKPYLGLHV